MIYLFLVYWTSTTIIGIRTIQTLKLQSVVTLHDIFAYGTATFLPIFNSVLVLLLIYNKLDSALYAAENIVLWRKK